MPGDVKGGLRYIAEGIGVRSDAPFRFGPDPFTTFDWGNSYIRAHYKSIEAGLSTEPLWWGPMQRYPLIMSNNAPGVPHAFLGTRELLDRKSTRLNSSHVAISYAVFCLKKINYRRHSTY